MQVELLKAMVAAGKDYEAEQLRVQFQLPAAVVPIDPAKVAVQAASRAANLLALPFPLGNILFVQDTAGVRRYCICITSQKLESFVSIVCRPHTVHCKLTRDLQMCTRVFLVRCRGCRNL